MAVVTSKDNRLVKQWRALCRDAHARRESGLYAIEGARLCEDALRSGFAPQVLLYTAEARESYPAAVEALCAAAEQAVEITPSLSRTMADTVGPQGVFCTVRSPMALDDRPILDKIDTTGRYVVLEDIRDPGNLGTMIRAAEAFGLNGLLLSDGCCDVGNPKVLRGSMGGVFRLPLLAAGDLPETIAALQARGMTAYACVVDPGAWPVDTAGVTAPGSLCAIGNEGSGLRQDTVAACAQRVTIRMAGRAESLNASLAAGIVMWEMVRPHQGGRTE